MDTYTVKGTYGSGKTKCLVFVYEKPSGKKWYAVEGSQNVNATYQDIDNGVDVEELQDCDYFTLSKTTVNSEDDLIYAVNL